MLGHSLTLDEHLLAASVLGESPQDGSIIDIEDHPPPVFFRDADCFSRSRRQIRPRKVGARDQQNLGRTDEVSVDVVLGQSQIGGILIVEDSRKVVAFPDGQGDQASEPFGIKSHRPGINVFIEKGRADKPSEWIVAHTSDHRCPQTETRCSDTNVAGTSADIHLE